MKLVIDTKEGKLIQEIEGNRRILGFYTDEAFELISEQWLKVGWNQKYSYTFTWMGRPVIQIPEDMIRVQEVIYRVKPDVIIETGIAHGGSLVFYASLCKAMGKGRVIGIDIEIRPHNRKAIETHELSPLVTLVEGSSIASQVVERVKSFIKPPESVLVILDSSHSKEHVLKELEAYHNLITFGSYILVTDGIIKDLVDVPRGKEEWAWDNPVAAVVEFTKKHPEFIVEEPVWSFNESELKKRITQWPRAFLKRI
jgi:cephalosporin hydroxylase